MKKFLKSDIFFKSCVPLKNAVVNGTPCTCTVLKKLSYHNGHRTKLYKDFYISQLPCKVMLSDKVNVDVSFLFSLFFFYHFFEVFKSTFPYFQIPWPILTSLKRKKKSLVSCANWSTPRVLINQKGSCLKWGSKQLWSCF